MTTALPPAVQAKIGEIKAELFERIEFNNEFDAEFAAGLLDDTADILAGEMVELWANWTPTAENINALPEKLRSYIMNLETQCDPAGDVANLILTRDQNKMLAAKISTQAARIEVLAREMAGIKHMSESYSWQVTDAFRRQEEHLLEIATQAARIEVLEGALKQAAELASHPLQMIEPLKNFADIREIARNALGERK